MSYEVDMRDLISLGLDEDRLKKHTVDEISLAMCAVQESGNALEMIEEIGDEATAVLYAESCLGW